jgi:hypothetical protein
MKAPCAYGFSPTRILVRVRGPPRIARLSRMSVGNGCKDGKGVSHGPLPNGVKYVVSHHTPPAESPERQAVFRTHLS